MRLLFLKIKIKIVIVGVGVRILMEILNRLIFLKLISIISNISLISTVHKSPIATHINTILHTRLNFDAVLAFITIRLFVGVGIVVHVAVEAMLIVTVIAVGVARYGVVRVGDEICRVYSHVNAYTVVVMAMWS